jgi:hypothetical protein
VIGCCRNPTDGTVSRPAAGAPLWLEAHAMRRIPFLVACLTALLLTGCSGEKEVPSSPGNPAAYQRIAALTSCSGLQKEFDVAMVSVDSREPGDALRAVSLTYATYADERMKSLDCY